MPPPFAKFWRVAAILLLLWSVTLGALLSARAETAPAQQASQNTLGAEPGELIVKRAFWQDSSAQASLSTAQTQNYTAYQGIFSQGYSDSAHWIRLTLAASAQPIGLRITPAWLDNITLYDPATPGTPITVGDQHQAQNNALPGLGHSFELAPSHAQRDIWLRLQTTSGHLLNVQAMPVDQVAQASSRQILWASFYGATLLVILLVLASIWWVQRDPLLAAYLVRHVAYIFYGLAYLGIPVLLLPSGLPPTFFDLAFSLSGILVIPLAIRFDLAFLDSYRPQKHLRGLLKAVGLASIGVLLVFLSGHVRQALQLNVLLLLVGTVVLVVAVLSCKPAPSTEQLLPAKAMRFYYGVIAISLVIGLSNALGWFKTAEWSLYILIQHGLFTSVLMTVMLFVRTQRMAKLNQQTAWQLQQAQQGMAAEQQRSREQSQFMHMLMHELKTPLSVAALALGTQNKREENIAHAGQALRDMKSVLDRCLQADQIGHARSAQHQQGVDVAALIGQLADNTPLLQVRFQLSIAPALTPVQTDSQLLKIALNNLLDNAAHYSDPLTPVLVSVQPQQQDGQAGLSVRVANTPGLAGWPDEAQLFNKYYRANGAQRESGSGLGLYLSRQLANSLGGTLSYTPSAQLVEFHLWLPLRLA